MARKRSVTDGPVPELPDAGRDRAVWVDGRIRVESAFRSDYDGIGRVTDHRDRHLRFQYRYCGLCGVVHAVFIHYLQVDRVRARLCVGVRDLESLGPV